MNYPIKPGDQVEWSSEARDVSGKIIKIYAADFEYKGYIHHATKEDPQYAIQSGKENYVALHKSKALTKFNK